MARSCAGGMRGFHRVGGAVGGTGPHARRARSRASQRGPRMAAPRRGLRGARERLARRSHTRVFVSAACAAWHGRPHLPRGRRPVRIVVAFLGTLEAGPRPVGVLARAGRAVRVQVLVRSVQPLVTLTLRTGIVKGRRLVQPTVRIRVVRIGRATVGAVPQWPLADVVGRVLAERAAYGRLVGLVIAHVLDDNLALGCLRAARVLCGPRDRELAPGVVLDGLGGAHAGVVCV